MNIYEIIIEVLKAARDKGASLDNDWEIEDIATEIYDMYYRDEITQDVAARLLDKLTELSNKKRR